MVKVLGDLILGEEIGKGSFGVVRLAKHKDNPSKKYAVKVLSKEKIFQSKEARENYLNEVQAMKSLTHSNVMKLYWEIETHNNCYLVLRYCQDGDLSSYLEKKGIQYLSEEETIGYLKQIANGFKAMNQKHIMHRDFKLENILVDKGTLVIADFGCSKNVFPHSWPLSSFGLDRES